jgi:hypothetical protein
MADGLGSSGTQCTLSDGAASSLHAVNQTVTRK